MLQLDRESESEVTEHEGRLEEFVGRFKVSVQLGVTWGRSNEIHSLFRGKEERGESGKMHSSTHLAGGAATDRAMILSFWRPPV